jgi:photosystem II stability/assembly factor-like uncharacterized protein
MLRTLLCALLLGPSLLAQSLPAGHVSVLAASPANPNTVLAGASAGVYRSTDAGRTWSRTGLASVEDLAFDPANPSILYAATAFGISKSVDGGQTWTDSPARFGCAWSLAVVRGDPSRVYVGTCGAGVFLTTDGGQTRTSLNIGLPDKSVVISLAVDPSDSTTIYAGTNDGVFKTTDAGKQWTSLAGHPASRVTGLAIAPTQPPTIYASSGPLRMSEDGGATWTAIAPDLLRRVTRVTVDSRNPAALYAATTQGALKSLDAGRHWTPMILQPPATSTAVLHIALAPHNPSTVYVGTDRFGVFKSADAGLNWGASSSGIRSMGVLATALDPTDPKTIYAGTAYAGVYQSRDAGANWEPFGAGDYTRSLAFAPGPGRTLYVGSLNAGLFSSTSGENWRRAHNSAFVFAIHPWNPSIIYSADLNAMYQSADAGRTWQRMSTPLPKAPEAIAIDPVRPDTLYAAVSGTGVFKSTDAGKTWVITGPVPGPRNVLMLAIDPKNPDLLFVGSGGTLLRSDDAGQTWTTVIRSQTRAVAFDPRPDGAIYAGGGGMYKSTDGGRTWARIEQGFVPRFFVRSLAIDPQSGTVYAGTEGNGMYRTTDGGATWTAR